MPKQLKNITDLPSVLGAVLLEIRKKRKLKQPDLAQACEMTTSNWSRIENGRVALTVVQLSLVAEKLGLSASEVLHETEQQCDKLRERGVEVRTRRLDSSEGPHKWVSFVPLFGSALVVALGMSAAIANGLLKEEKSEQ